MENDVQLLAFTLDGEEYAIDITYVQEIIRLLDITRVPHASSYMSGVINLRGMIIPVMDIRKRFGLSEKNPDETTRIVIINWQGLMVGIIVDSVSEVIRISKGYVEQPPACSAEVNARYFTGIGKIGNRLLIMLSLGDILELTLDV